MTKYEFIEYEMFIKSFLNNCLFSAAAALVKSNSWEMLLLFNWKRRQMWSARLYVNVQKRKKSLKFNSFEKFIPLFWLHPKIFTVWYLVWMRHILKFKKGLMNVRGSKYHLNKNKEIVNKTKNWIDKTKTFDSFLILSFMIMFEPLLVFCYCRFVCTVDIFKTLQF